MLPTKVPATAAVVKAADAVLVRRSGSHREIPPRPAPGARVARRASLRPRRTRCTQRAHRCTACSYLGRGAHRSAAAAGWTAPASAHTRQRRCRPPGRTKWTRGRGRPRKWAEPCRAVPCC
eukprot:scaffold4286_cov60-Phaeocystis_antarctica.AAC.1